MRVAGVPFDPGDHPRGPFTPTAIVLHRTYGRWRSDYQIGKHGRDGQPIGFQLLIGKGEGQWAQFHDSATKCNHAAGANRWAIGIELEGTNEEPLTDWQVRALAWVVAQLCDHHNIPRTYAFGGKRREVKGLLPHALVPGSNHTDFVTLADWERVKALWATPATQPPQPVQAVTNTTSASPTLPTRPTLHLGDTCSDVFILQCELAAVTGQGGDYQHGVFDLHVSRTIQDVGRILNRSTASGETFDGVTVTQDTWNAVDFLAATKGALIVSA